MLNWPTVWPIFGERRDSGWRQRFSHSHVWRPDSGISSHLIPVGDYGVPFEIAANRDHPGTDRDDGLPTLLARAGAVINEAAAKLVAMQSTPLRTERKDHLDIVTEADLASEAMICGPSTCAKQICNSCWRAGRTGSA